MSNFPIKNPHKSIDHPRHLKYRVTSTPPPPPSTSGHVHVTILTGHVHVTILNRQNIFSLNQQEQRLNKTDKEVVDSSYDAELFVRWES